MRYFHNNGRFRSKPAMTLLGTQCVKELYFVLGAKMLATKNIVGQLGIGFQVAESRSARRTVLNVKTL